jgi:prepilin-type N-terminal cleavage/methylation domain-containing protein
MAAGGRIVIAARMESAFTLIELLIVVAIISILASIAVPNFTEAQTRAKCARVQSDMRTLLVGVESYMVDQNAYPVRFTDDEVLPRLATQKPQMSSLTTPVAYLASLPEDLFAKAHRYPNNGIDFYDSRQTGQFLAPRYGIPVTRWTAVQNYGYVMVSVGPDGAIGAPSENYLDYPHQGGALRTLYVVYDPTNGTVSFGNIFRFQGDRPPVQVLNPEP